MISISHWGVFPVEMSYWSIFDQSFLYFYYNGYTEWA